MGAPTDILVKHQLAGTCLDQVDEQINFIENDKVNAELQAPFLQKLANEMNVSEMLCSYGPTMDIIKNGEHRQHDKCSIKSI